MQGPKEERPGHIWLAASLAVFAIIASIIGGWSMLRRNQPVSIAVLPLVDFTKEGGDPYIADGLTSEIISELTIIEGLTVRSQTSSFAFKSKSGDVREAGKQLAADYIVEGSVAREGSKSRIDVRLIRTRDDTPIWSEKFEPDRVDLLSIRDEISRGIVNSLRLKLGRGRRRYETSPEAYDLYLRGRALANRRFPGNNEVIQVFQKAIAKDPLLAPAYASLAGAYAYRSFGRANNPDHEETLSNMRAAAEKAIQLDPLLAEAHSALGVAYARNAQWEQAELSLRRAIQMAPNLSIAHANLAMFFLFPLGRLEEALREERVDLQLDPLSGEAHYRMGLMLISAGRYDEAASYCEKLPAEDSLRGECLGRARLGQGRAAEALKVLATSNEWGYLAYAYEKTGHHDEAEKLLANAPLVYPKRQGPLQYALVFAGRSDRRRTIDELERASGVGAVRIGFTLTEPEFAFIRDDPRVRTLRRKVGLPE